MAKKAELLPGIIFDAIISAIHYLSRVYMKLLLTSSFLIFCLSISMVSAQSKDTLSVYYYNKGLSALSADKTEEAKDFFKKSVKEENNAPAEYELAKIYEGDTSHSMWNISREHIKNAVTIDPDNITYRIFYGKLSEALFKMSKLEFNAEDDAIRQYEKVLEIDSSNIYASRRLGEIKSKEFLEFNNSVEKFSDGSDLLGSINNVQKSLNNRTLGNTRSQQLYELQNIAESNLMDYVKVDFNYAVKALINTIKYDSLNPTPYLTLGSIYEDSRQPAKGIPFLQRLTKIVPVSKSAHLELGLLYYRNNQPDSAYSEYAKAILLMDNAEREDFTYNSVRVLLEPFLGDKMGNISDDNLKKVIDIFWKARDPLNITPYNERLLEHYSRVAYSNLRFSVPDLNITGWKTDRGITAIRYGIPPKRIRFRPGVNMDVSKTDVWIYDDKIFSFTDDLRNGNFKYAKPANTQYYGDSQEFAKDLLATQPEAYTPEFEGPKFDSPYKPAQFKDIKNNNLTDVIVSYGIKVTSDSLNELGFKYGHKTGFYFFDKYFNKIAEDEKSIGYLNPQNQITIPDSGAFITNSIEMKTRPGSGNMSFEIMRNYDKGVAAYHGHLTIRNFNSTELQLSDIILASDIENGKTIKGRIQRNNYFILPNPAGIFNGDNNFYIYYEIYNLVKNENGLTDFSQDIILQERDDEGVLGKIFSPVLKIIGIDNSKKLISLSSNYQTKDKDSQLYLQLDMNGYEPGEYVLTIKIKDNITGKESEQSTELTWK